MNVEFKHETWDNWAFDSSVKFYEFFVRFQTHRPMAEIQHRIDRMCEDYDVTIKVSRDSGDSNGLPEDMDGVKQINLLFSNYMISGSMNYLFDGASNVTEKKLVFCK